MEQAKSEPKIPQNPRTTRPQITVPSAGQHIVITGPYVLDTEHYNWAEIHPVYSLVIG